MFNEKVDFQYICKTNRPISACIVSADWLELKHIGVGQVCARQITGLLYLLNPWLPLIRVNPLPHNPNF